jgi:serine/alanine adding enzyme
MKIRLYNQSDKEAWDSYALNHPDSMHCHLSGWKSVIENTYGHKSYYLMAIRSPNPSNPINSINQIIGILPLFHIKSLFFGNHLISMPFLNYGGILADNEETEIALLSETIKLGQKLKVSSTELRHLKPLLCLNKFNSSNTSNSINPSNPMNPINYVTKTHKVRMLLELPHSKEELLKSFKAKLRSQISRPQKEGMTTIIGGMELLDSFYKVFSINMRDLGSPVHSKGIFKQIRNEFPQNVKIGIVNYQKVPVAAGIIFCFRDTVEIPWASSLKKFNKLSPNMLLYWSFMEYACDSGFKCFDFGRSTPDEGTYKFKEQWGAKPSPLYWQNIVFNGHPVSQNDLEKSKFERAIHYWKKLPVPISNKIGPLIRKHISL